MSVKLKIKLLSSDEIKLDQDGIRSDMKSIDARIHANAVQCLAHAAQHGDTSLMRRLLVDIVDQKSGYRRQGLIGWMRKHSPMELKADNIDLSGFIMSEAQRKAMIAAFPEVDEKLFVVGERRPFLVDEANASHFTTDNANREKTVAIFQGTLLSPVDAMIKKFTAACENTVNGEPLDPSKPFYDGTNMDKVQEFLETVKAAKAQLPADATAEIRARQVRHKEDTEFLSAVKDNKDAGGAIEVVKATGTNG